MSKFILVAGLVMSLLTGVATLSPSLAAPPVESLPVAGDFTWHDYGPYNDYRFAWAMREKWRDLGHGANILERHDGFWVRVFDK
jgi:hypothetical protein